MWSSLWSRLNSSVASTKSRKDSARIVAAMFGASLAMLSGVAAFAENKNYGRQEYASIHSLSWRKNCRTYFDSTKLFLSESLTPKLASCDERLPVDLNEITSEVDLSQYEPMKRPDRASDGNKHAIFGTLLGDGKIENYDIYKRKKDKKGETNKSDLVIAHVDFGKRLNGHHDVVHGGILSLIFDDAFGFGYESLNIAMAVTANLTVDFRAPVPAGTKVRISLQLEHREGRKIFMTGQMKSLDQQILYAEAKSLYIIPRHVASS